MLQVPTETYKSIIQIIRRPGRENLIFGCCFEQPANQVVLFKEHMYSLFLLFEFHGEAVHKDMVLGKIAECREFHENAWLGDSGGAGAGGPGLGAKERRDLLEMLEYTEKELRLTHPDKQKIHTMKQQEAIRNTFKTILQLDKKLTVKSQINFLTFTEMAASIIGCSCEVHDFYQFQILHIQHQEFEYRNLDVFIEINKETETFRYIKQRQDPSMTNHNHNHNQSSFMFTWVTIKKEESYMLQDSYMVDGDEDEDEDQDQDIQESLVAVRKMENTITKHTRNGCILTVSTQGKVQHNEQPAVMGAPAVEKSQKKIKRTNSTSIDQEQQGTGTLKTQPTLTNIHIYNQDFIQKQHQHQGHEIENSFMYASQFSQTCQVNIQHMEESLRRRVETFMENITLMDFLRRNDTLQVPTMINSKIVEKANKSKLKLMNLSRRVEDIYVQPKENQLNMPEISPLMPKIVAKKKEVKWQDLMCKVLQNIFKDINKTETKSTNQSEPKDLRSRQQQIRINNNQEDRPESPFMKNVSKKTSGTPNKPLLESLKKSNYSQLRSRAEQLNPDALQFSSTLRSRFRNPQKSVKRLSS